MIKIPKEKKSKLNRLISYYRHIHSKTNERFLPKNFILDNEGLYICTIYTLSRIENNKTMSYDNIYFSLLDNLKIHYINESKVDKIIHAVNLSILKSAEINDSKHIIDRINKTLKMLSPYLDYAIYKEQAEVYQILLDYYADYKFNTALIDKYNILFDLVDEPLKPVLIEIVYNYYVRINLDAKKSLNTLKLLNKCNCNSIICDYLSLLLNFREYKLTKEKELGEKLIAKCESKGNRFYLCKTYNVLASLYTRQNPTIAINYLQKAIDGFDNKLDSKHNLAVYMTNLANNACMNKMYDLAVNSFKKLKSIQPESIFIVFPYYIYSLEKTNSHTDTIKIILNELSATPHKIKDSILMSLLNLLLIKYKMNEQLDVSMITNVLSKSFGELKQTIPILDIIEFELYGICKSSNSLNIYKDFMKNFH